MAADFPKLEAAPLAVVTGGAGQGIGHGISEVLAEHGWRVLIVELDESLAAALVDQLTDRGLAARQLTLDLTGQHAPAAVLQAARDWGPPFAGLVNNAGIGLHALPHELSLAEIDRVLDLNLRAVYRLTAALIPELITARGSVVNISSVHAPCPAPLHSIYAASKGAIESVTRAWAVDYGSDGLRVNCVRPGLVDGPQTRQLMAQAYPDVEAWIRDVAHTKQAIPHLSRPREVGELVAFLMGPRCPGLSGQVITLDAGATNLLWNRD